MSEGIGKHKNAKDCTASILSFARSYETNGSILPVSPYAVLIETSYWTWDAWLLFYAFAGTGLSGKHRGWM